MVILLTWQSHDNISLPLLHCGKEVVPIHLKSFTTTLLSDHQKNKTYYWPTLTIITNIFYGPEGSPSIRLTLPRYVIYWHLTMRKVSRATSVFHLEWVSSNRSRGIVSSMWQTYPKTVNRHGKENNDKTDTPIPWKFVSVSDRWGKYHCTAVLQLCKYAFNCFTTANSQHVFFFLSNPVLLNQRPAVQ